MDRTVDHGPEVAPSTDPEVAAQPDENKYCIEPEISDHPIASQSGHLTFSQSNQSNAQAQVKRLGLVKARGVLIIMIFLLLAVALGLGLGVGLSAQHKQNSPR